MAFNTSDTQRNEVLVPSAAKWLGHAAKPRDQREKRDDDHPQQKNSEGPRELSTQETTFPLSTYVRIEGSGAHNWATSAKISRQ